MFDLLSMSIVSSGSLLKKVVAFVVSALEVSGARGLSGERDGGGGAGSGFSRLSCKLRSRACDAGAVLTESNFQFAVRNQYPRPGQRVLTTIEQV